MVEIEGFINWIGIGCFKKIEVSVVIVGRREVTGDIIEEAEF